MQIDHIAAFTDHGRGGNPAGVVIGKTMPEAPLMQKVATEVGYSETAFAAHCDNGWMVRYYAPAGEVPFCGHATIALGAALVYRGQTGKHRLLLSEGQIDLEAFAGEAGPHCSLQSLPTKNAAVGEAVVIDALRLFDYQIEDIDGKLPVRRIHAGADHLLLPLKDRQLLARMNYSLDQGREFMLGHGLTTISLIWRESDQLFHSRNAFASGGVLEDPATGAAAAALGGLLRDEGFAAPGEITVLQGEDMGRPSRITVRAGGEPGSGVTISGTALRMRMA